MLVCDDSKNGRSKARDHQALSKERGGLPFVQQKLQKLHLLREASQSDELQIHS